MHEHFCCEVCDALILAQDSVALILAQGPSPNLGIGATPQVRNYSECPHSIS